MSTSKSCLLPKDVLEARLSQIDLLRAMYPSQDETIIEPQVIRWLDQLSQWCIEEDKATDCIDLNAGHDEDEPRLDAIPEILSISLNLRIQSGDANQSCRIDVSVDVPVRVEVCTGKDGSAIDPPPFKIRLRQPRWLSKLRTVEINQAVQQKCSDDDDMFGIIDYLCQRVEENLEHPNEFQSSQQPMTKSQLPIVLGTISGTSSDSNGIHHVQKLVRVWFYFPSLSTRSKRNDLVSTAPHYELTGFVLAGKPGILCLEGQSENVDNYMRYIKTESWGDIPSHQKKVSERYRETIERRVFEDMQEITDKPWMGDKRGERGNRNDLKALEGWLAKIGLVNAFATVLM